MHVVKALFVTMVLFGAALVSVSAQSTDGPALSPDVRTLYAHSDDAETIGIWMNTLADDPVGDGVSWPILESFPQGSGFSLEIAFVPGLAGIVELDPAGTIEVSAYLGGGVQSLGQISVSTRLMNGDTTIAQGESQTHRFLPTPAGSTYELATWSLTPDVTELDPTQDLVWVIEGSGNGNNLFLATSADRGRSNIELPVLSAGGGSGPPDGLEAEFTNTTAQVSFNATNATTAEFDLAWNSTLTNASVNYLSVITNGSFVFTLNDGAGPLMDANLTGLFQSIEDFETTTPGNWSLNVTLTDFVGEFTIVIGELPPPAPPVTNTTTNTTTTDDGDSTGIPGPGLLVFVAFLAAAAVAVRRRT